MMPCFSHIVCTNPLFGFCTFGLRYLFKKALILSPKKAATNTPVIPPTTLAKNIVHGLKPNAKPAGIAAYISKVANAATVSIFIIVDECQWAMINGQWAIDNNFLAAQVNAKEILLLTVDIWLLTFY